MSFDKTKDDEKKSIIVVEQYKKRINYLKKGQEFSARGDVVKSIEYYKSYLNILCEYFEITEDKLSPSLFPDKKDQAEIFIISQVLWDMAKTFDRNTKTRPLVPKYLNLFVKFSIGFKFHHVNADLLRKFIKLSSAHNMEPFKQTYERMKIANKSCYIATHCYGETHEITEKLRTFKQQLLRYSIGSFLVGEYYHYSPKLVALCQKSRAIDVFLRLIAKPLLFIIAHLSNRVRLYEHS
jgi:hypothetical protein